MCVFISNESWANITYIICPVWGELTPKRPLDQSMQSSSHHWRTEHINILSFYRSTALHLCLLSLCKRHLSICQFISWPLNVCWLFKGLGSVISSIYSFLFQINAVLLNFLFIEESSIMVSSKILSSTTVFNIDSYKKCLLSNKLTY